MRRRLLADLDALAPGMAASTVPAEGRHRLTGDLRPLCALSTAHLRIVLAPDETPHRVLILDVSGGT